MTNFEITLLIIYIFMASMEFAFIVEDCDKFQEQYRKSRVTIILAFVSIILAPITIAWQLGELLYHSIRKMEGI